MSDLKVRPPTARELAFGLLYRCEDLLRDATERRSQFPAMASRLIPGRERCGFRRTAVGRMADILLNWARQYLPRTQVVPLQEARRQSKGEEVLEELLAGLG